MSELLSDCSELASRLIKYIRAYRSSLFGIELPAATQLSRSSSRRGCSEDLETVRKKSIYRYCSILEVCADSNKIVDTEVVELWIYLCKNKSVLLTSCCLYESMNVLCYSLLEFNIISIS